ncbi:imidazole glycerol phosphate synthase subunit HisH [Blochmannia endosymbiont of Colobopsis nipponica]|uniref:imidazole glycerol phosphate synthase subunit HisH n=1 Tax=Blochmannia endosymbiont of Colobopsis nipponica TaxID=2681987 RepID=UPI001785EEE2|nr:imidazole glycerol phosphate synthase subunit HisH [Blochmannia endosymbiont of Colobopsis nipponica]QOI10995.1 imidazole glycerol phosphate synthase subunit HisH [Blochmannia endosymbiont of Colobopsis nipponica]
MNVIINTGCSNLFSISTAIRNLGHRAIISKNANDILKANKLFLPGVGSVKTAMQELTKNKLIKLIKDCKQPILGICLGMQLLGISSEENNGTQTLGIINTLTKKIENYGLPIPHIGWNKIKIKNQHCLFHKIKDDYFYFVHSYAMPICDSTIATTCHGHSFTAVIKHKNFFGVQFHPEKSGKIGKQLLKNFLEI